MKLNWSEYQVSIDGKEKLVGDLTVDELRLSLCEAIDALEAVDAAADEVTERIESWRKGEAVMDAAEARINARLAAKKVAEK